MEIKRFNFSTSSVFKKLIRVIHVDFLKKVLQNFKVLAEDSLLFCCKYVMDNDYFKTKNSSFILLHTILQIYSIDFRQKQNLFI